MNLPNRIREIRNSRKLTLEQVGLQVGCSLVQISDLERGQRRLTDKWMKRIAETLGVAASDLLLESDAPGGFDVDELLLVHRYRCASAPVKAAMQTLLTAADQRERNDGLAPRRASR